MKKYAFVVVLLTMFFWAPAQESSCKKVVFWGDSLTAPHEHCYPVLFGELMGPDYEIVNCGVGGENTVTIMGRQGSAPMLLAHDVTVFKTDERRFPIFIGNNDIPAFKSSYNGMTLTPLCQGGWEESGPSQVNPVRIGGKSFTIKSESRFWTEGGEFQFENNYYIEPNFEVGETIKLKKGALIETAAMRNHRDGYAYVFLLGANNGFKDLDDYLNQLRTMVEYAECERFVIISFHIRNNVMNTTEKMDEMEKALEDTYGDHYINLRRYMNKSGLTDAGIEATEQDRKDIADGFVPCSLLSDGCHFTDKGYYLIGHLLAKRFRELGY